LDRPSFLFLSTARTLSRRSFMADFVAEVGNFSREARAAASWSKL
jgi:hypothetical protein